MDFKNNKNLKFALAFFVAGLAYFVGVLQTIALNCEENNIAPILFAFIGFILTIVLSGLIKVWKNDISIPKKILTTIITGFSWSVILFLPFLVAFGSLGSDSC